MNQYQKVNPAANDDNSARNNMMDLWKESVDRNTQARKAPQDVAKNGDESRADLEQRIRNGQEPCPTCAARKYQDGSNDPGVSFKSPGHISAGASAGAVMSHEMEHVTRNAADAKAKGGTANSSVMLFHDVCPTCGRSYVSGGLTRTTTSIPQEEPKNPFAKGLNIKA